MQEIQYRGIGEEFYLSDGLRYMKIDYVINGVVRLEAPNKGVIFELWPDTRTYSNYPLVDENRVGVY